VPSSLGYGNLLLSYKEVGKELQSLIDHQFLKKCSTLYN
jgi:hypothetical protein